MMFALRKDIVGVVGTFTLSQSDASLPPPIIFQLAAGLDGISLGLRPAGGTPCGTCMQRRRNQLPSKLVKPPRIVTLSRIRKKSIQSFGNSGGAYPWLKQSPSSFLYPGPRKELGSHKSEGSSDFAADLAISYIEKM